MPRIEVNFYSNSLFSDTSVTVVLPQKERDFMSGGARTNDEGKIPSVTLLHGMGGDHTNWLRYSNAEKYALNSGVAFIMPEVNTQSCYCNMVDGIRYFDYIAYELPKAMREYFPQLSERREDNLIMGLSMGGYGALKIGLSRPEAYRAIGCFSGFNATDFFYDETMPFLEPVRGMNRNAFGVGKTEDIKGTDGDIEHLFHAAKKSGKPIPDIFMCCGMEDFLKAQSDKLASFFSENMEEGTFTYRGKGHGAHNWEFWDFWLPRFLEWGGYEDRHFRDPEPTLD